MKSKDLDYISSFFSSSEFALCASLVALGFTLDSIDKNNTQKVTFNFKRTQDLDEAIQKFWNRQLLIEPISYFEAQRYLKSRIYGG